MSREGAPRLPSSSHGAREFERALVNGLGRALLLLRQHDPAPYRAAILRACTHYTGYDWQVEGYRDLYLYEVLQATGDADSFVEPILLALRRATKSKHASQLVRLAVRFAADGRDDARAAAYDKFDQNDADEPFLGAHDLVWLDGRDGLLHVSDRMGAEPLSEGFEWLPGSVIRESEEVIGKDETWEALAQAQQGNPRIRAFVEVVARVTREQESAKREPYVSKPDLRGMSYDEARPLIASSPPPSLGPGGLGRWGDDAGDDDLARAAAELLVQTDPQVLASYLMLFARRPFPLDPEPLRSLVQHPIRQVMLAAYRALSQIEHPKVRALALEILADTSVHGWKRALAINLLNANYEPDDELLFSQLLQRPRGRVEYHTLGLGALAIMESHPDRLGVPALLSLYERGACSHCRERVVELLHDLGEAPAWMLEECRFDANLDLRETVRAWQEA